MSPRRKHVRDLSPAESARVRQYEAMRETLAQIGKLLGEDAKGQWRATGRPMGDFYAATAGRVSGLVEVALSGAEVATDELAATKRRVRQLERLAADVCALNGDAEQLQAAIAELGRAICYPGY